MNKSTENFIKNDLSIYSTWLNNKDGISLKIWALTTFSQYKNTILKVFDQLS